MAKAKEKAKTIGELRKSGYQVISVKEELRRNLIQRIQKKEEILPGIVGYEESVIPQLENAILSGQDVIMLGERGQAKSRIIRSLVNLLDDEVPIVAGCEISDNPFQPICKGCRDKVADQGDDVEIAWLPREERYGEKLATPDTTIADLIGEVDPIKIAEGRYLSDELTIHYGLIPRTNRGIFCINELPDLAERLQVGLLNIMEERDVQIRGHLVRLPLDVMLVASANPEDYTNRGRIITPLRDRYGAQIRTHYPRSAAHEIGIMEQEHTRFQDEDYTVTVPDYMKEIVAEITRLARRSPDVNQRSGVSVRASIADFESLLANAFRRAIRTGEKEVVPRISDLPYLIPTLSGKIEFETVEDGKEEQIIEKLIQGAVVAVFNRHLNVVDLEDVVTQFKAGATVEVSDTLPSKQYVKIVKQIEGFDRAVAKLEPGENLAVIASGVEFVLEGLHLNKRLNKDDSAGQVKYRG
ncbi:MAG: sigma 54-interacting transcriptional regulator [Chloroflexi bacterium]|nr:sigma 54-interacting transcriptional regulator [Chloroflexota bacterium]